MTTASTATRQQTDAYGYREPTIADARQAVSAATPLTAAQTWTGLLASAGLSGAEAPCADLARLFSVMAEHPDRAVSVSARALQIRLDTYHRLSQIQGHKAPCATTAKAGPR